MTKKFSGVAYWKVQTSVANWPALALDVLTPVEKAGLAVLGYERLPGGDQLSVTFNEERHQLLVANGQGRGVVRESESASRFVVCLIAVRKALGDISVVTDSQENVPTLPRQSYPLYAEDWQRVLPIAQELGLATGEAFVARHSAVFNHLF